MFVVIYRRDLLTASAVCVTTPAELLQASNSLAHTHTHTAARDSAGLFHFFGQRDGNGCL